MDFGEKNNFWHCWQQVEFLAGFHCIDGERLWRLQQLCRLKERTMVLPSPVKRFFGWVSRGSSDAT
jgi:hypothetical protein